MRYIMVNSILIQLGTYLLLKRTRKINTDMYKVRSTGLALPHLIKLNINSVMNINHVILNEKILFL